MGLGPNFKINLSIQNASKATVRNTPVVLMYPEWLYTASRKQLFIPVLVPGLTYNFEVCGGSDCVWLQHRHLELYTAAELRVQLSGGKGWSCSGVENDAKCCS